MRAHARVHTHVGAVAVVCGAAVETARRRLRRTRKVAAAARINRVRERDRASRERSAAAHDDTRLARSSAARTPMRQKGARATAAAAASRGKRAAALLVTFSHLCGGLAAFARVHAAACKPTRRLSESRGDGVANARRSLRLVYATPSRIFAPMPPRAVPTCHVVKYGIRAAYM